MRLTLQNEVIGKVVVIRCNGRIVTGEEVGALQFEVERLSRQSKKVVLQLAEVSHIDSGGLGALVRLFGVLRSSGGDLKLCELSPFFLQVLQVTNLLRLFQTFDSEKQAIEAFSLRPVREEETTRGSRPRIVCLDTSTDLLAYLNVLLKRSGYEPFTTRYLSDAVALMNATRPRISILGPGMGANELAIQKFREFEPKIQLLQLPSDFSTAEASQAGLELVDRLRSLIKPSAG
jgi:anti-sigma B factor antagonist